MAGNVSCWQAAIPAGRNQFAVSPTDKAETKQNLLLAEPRPTHRAHSELGMPGELSQESVPGKL